MGLENSQKNQIKAKNFEIHKIKTYQGHNEPGKQWRLNGGGGIQRYTEPSSSFQISKGYKILFVTPSPQKR